MRAVAQANIPWAALLNMVIALLSFTIFKKMQEATGLQQRLGYAVGGTLGTVIGIVITQRVYGH
jgi:hypothetical protein